MNPVETYIQLAKTILGLMLYF